MNVFCLRQVLGCHAQPTTAGEKWSSHYPHADGNGCSCYNNLGAYCATSCASSSNIRNHEVHSHYGRGFIRATCSHGNFVLGCGIKPLKTNGLAEGWRGYYVQSVDSCLCYDIVGATCYAICGQII